MAYVGAGYVLAELETEHAAQILLEMDTENAAYILESRWKKRVKGPPFLRFENWVVVLNMFHVHPYLGKWSNLTNIFQIGWNHQLETLAVRFEDDWGVKSCVYIYIYKYPVKEASLQCLYGFLTKFINLALSTLVGMGRRPKYKRISRIILRGIYWNRRCCVAEVAKD